MSVCLSVCLSVFLSVKMHLARVADGVSVFGGPTGNIVRMSVSQCIY